jgi:uncharacterized protein YdaU (DUF1376 family)
MTGSHPASAPDQSPDGGVDMANAKPTTAPAFQFYTADFLGSTKVDAMSMTERGVYITFLARCWQDNGLPTDPKALASMARMKPQQFARMWAEGMLHQCFYERGGKLHNRRLDKERNKQQDYRRRQSDNATRSWDKRRQGKATAEPMPPQRLATATAMQALHSSSSSSLSSSSSSSSHVPESAPFDIWAREFVDLYPRQGRCNALQLERELYSVLTADPAVPAGQAWAALKARLATHVSSARWADQGGRFIPRADKYLREGTHLQEMAPAGGIGSNPKTAGNVAALQSFVNRRTGATK